MEHPMHEYLHEHLRVTTLPQLLALDTEGPTMVWHRGPPDRRYWEWVVPLPPNLKIKEITAGTRQSIPISNQDIRRCPKSIQ